MSLSLRKAQFGDAEILLKWKNEEDTRRNSIITSEEIKWDDHLVWLSRTLDDPTVEFWIVLDDGKPIGDVRLNHGEETEISIRMDKICRGRGLATQVIGMFRGKLIAKIVAHNLASMRAFMSNGYKPEQYITGDVNYYVFKK